MTIAPRLQAALIAALAIASSSAAWGADSRTDPLSDADRQCLGCHGERGLEKTFAPGDTLALHVDAPAFARSVHASVGCAACHADVDLKTHPGGGKSFDSTRALAVAMTQTCRSCHEASFEAHKASVHGQALAKDGASSGAPLCTTCHGTHDIAHASVGTALRDTCLGCHADAPAAHDKWLPNTKLHLQVVACAVCHAPSAGKRVELRFYDVASKQELVSNGLPISFGGNGSNGGAASHPLNAEQLQELVRAIDRGGGSGKVVLSGRVEPASGGEGHRLLAKSSAVRECATCHRKGADPFQNVSLSVIGPDGERVRYETQTDVLHAPTSVESVRGFYAVGGTRIQLLDIVLLAAVLAGISAPLGHLIVRRIMRRKGERHE